MKSPTPTKPTINQILINCHVWYECPCRACKKSLKEAKSQLLQLVMDEVIGKDEINDYTWPDGTYDDKLKNSFREQLRQRARELLK